LQLDININFVGLIYKVTNLINNKIYIGQTIQNFDIYYKYHLSMAFNKKT